MFAKSFLRDKFIENERNQEGTAQKLLNGMITHKDSFTGLKVLESLRCSIHNFKRYNIFFAFDTKENASCFGVVRKAGKSRCLPEAYVLRFGGSCDLSNRWGSLEMTNSRSLFLTAVVSTTGCKESGSIILYGFLSIHIHGFCCQPSRLQ